MGWDQGEGFPNSALGTCSMFRFDVPVPSPFATFNPQSSIFAPPCQGFARALPRVWTSRKARLYWFAKGAKGAKGFSGWVGGGRR
jgi:hypothetical protein